MNGQKKKVETTNFYHMKLLEDGLTQDGIKCIRHIHLQYPHLGWTSDVTRMPCKPTSNLP
jgi:hypothetical protein